MNDKPPSEDPLDVAPVLNDVESADNNNNTTGTDDPVNILSEESIRQLNHDDLVKYALQVTNAASQVLQLIDLVSKANVQVSELKEEVSELKDEVAILKADLEKTASELAISQNASTLLQSTIHNIEDRLTQGERNTLSNGQYLRRRQLEISSIPNDHLKLEVPKLKTKMAEFLTITGVKVTWNDIDKCHLLNNNKVIIELKVREKRDAILRARKDLKKKSKQLSNIKYEKAIISESLCPEYNRLFYLCRCAKRDKVVSETWFFNGRLFIKMSEDAERQQITHIYDLYDKLGVEYVNGKLNKD